MDRGKILFCGVVCACAVIGALFPLATYAVEVSDKVIAIVNNDVITMSELIAEAAMMSRATPRPSSRTHDG